MNEKETNLQNPIGNPSESSILESFTPSQPQSKYSPTFSHPPMFSKSTRTPSKRHSSQLGSETTPSPIQIVHISWPRFAIITQALRLLKSDSPLIQNATVSHRKLAEKYVTCQFPLKISTIDEATVMGNITTVMGNITEDNLFCHLHQNFWIWH